MQYKQNTPYQFYEYAKKHLKGVTLLYVSREEIEDSKGMLESRWTHIKPVQFVQSMHYFIAANEFSLSAALTCSSVKTVLSKIV